ncbi:MAG: hypothetical protein QOI62_806 [Solirubrobacteraceae bacterium]|jgi:uncharacterized cupin superfamily protein|nr:hypothetical protein [Solirubrobacteraceae bacterium]
MLAHWDDVGPVVVEAGDLGGTRWRLGDAAGAATVGLSRYRLDPGRRAMPVHVHGDEEEIFYVLAGEGLSWQDGRTYRLRAGDAILHAAGAEAHTIVGAGDGLDVLAFGGGSPTHLTWLPRAGTMWAAPHWLPVDGAHPFEAEAAVGPLEVPDPEPERPATIVALDDLPVDAVRRGDVARVRRDLGVALGSRPTGLRHLVVEPGALSGPPHCHSSEEELFVVLEGEGALLLGDEEHPVRPGTIVSRPPGTGVAHAFRAGDGPLTLLAYGTRDPSDIVYYPRSGKVSLRGVKAIFRVERVDYWDGEG